MAVIDVGVLFGYTYSYVRIVFCIVGEVWSVQQYCLNIAQWSQNMSIKVFCCLLLYGIVRVKVMPEFLWKFQGIPEKYSRELNFIIYIRIINISAIYPKKISKWIEFYYLLTKKTMKNKLMNPKNITMSCIIYITNLKSLCYH